MNQKYLILFSIIVLAFFAGNFVEPRYLNRGVDFLNQKLSLHLPHFWDRPFKLGLDLRGGVHLVYEADLEDIEKKDRAEKMEGLKDIIERRINIYGVTEPLVQIQGGDRLIVELAGIKDVKEAVKMIGETPYLEFKEIFSETEKQKLKENISEEEISKAIKEAESQIGREVSREEILEALTSNLFKTTELTGEYLKGAELIFDQTTYKPEVELQFTKKGAEVFEKITERNIGKPLAIFLDGLSIVDTDGDGYITVNDNYAPIIQGKISGGKAVITGNMDDARAKEIVRRLNSGALPVKIGEPISQKIIGPTLGMISVKKSLLAGVFGFLAVILFMVFFYRMLGVIAFLSLGIYVALVLSLFKLIPVTITLAGVGGFILSMGMAVDANILIFSRMREELKEEKSFGQAIIEGFRRAWPSIRDGNLTTLIVAFILFFFGTSFIKGFALTLSIGVLLSMFSAFFITKGFLKLFEGTRWEKVKWLWR